MNKDNVSPVSHSKRAKASISLAAVEELIKKWRANKKSRSEKVPSAIWDKVFILLESLPESQVLNKLGLTRTQLQNQKSERQGTPGNAKVKASNVQTTNKDIEFCEAEHSSFPLDSKPAEAYATNTCVVELYRPDGMLMKIHICTDRFDELLRAFYQGAISC